MKIGIFGGTFDPIHNAHLIIAQYAREQFSLDRLMLMPGGNPPHKRGTVTDKKARYEMTCIAADNDFEVSRYEVDREEYSYTLNTLKYLKEVYPNDEIYFIIGEDSLNDIYTWHKPKEILKLCILLVFPRYSMLSLEDKISEVTSALGGNIKAIDAPILEISSTMLRKRIRKEKSVKHMLPEAVRLYIEKNDLYKE
ncbi:MAG: nicotinate-nucleotide adenylyltransferase [Clostridiales bacterium]|nr:nicotinate-nucleotide adenylyltransferase [Clostridiales bacterium]